MTPREQAIRERLQKMFRGIVPLSEDTEDIDYLLQLVSRYRTALETYDKVYWEMIGGGKSVEIAERVQAGHDAYQAVQCL